MNISYNWLKDFIDTELTPQQLAEALTSIGLETGSVEEVESIRGGLRGLVIGKVLTCVEHPDSDHLHITTVDLGGEAPVQIVCGAPNVAAGQAVVVATVGTTLYDGDKEFKIKRSKIRGVESLGMICAEDEIGVGTSHDGIIVIDRDVKPGTPAAEYFGLTSDYVLEVDLTPNRVDAASHYGVARDLAAWSRMHSTPRDAKRPSVDAFRSDRPDGAVDITVADTQGCIRYTGLTLRGVKVTESPRWLKDRLSVIGQRPINCVVDVTNYILHGIGQPLHAFDVAKIDGSRVVVDTVAEGTPFTTLDGVERKLSSADLMICSASEPMCIAGVFGGMDSGVTEATVDVFLESACFNPTRIRKTARRHGLQTDASFRYERGTDPNITLYAVKLAALLIKEIAGGEICGDPIDIYPVPVLPYDVTLDFGYARRLIGKDIPSGTLLSIARSLEMEVAESNDEEARLLVPTYRVDVQRPCDVVEDLLRIYGYNNVEMGTTLQSSLSYKSEADLDCALTNLISDQLTAEGFNEILNNSLTARRYYADSQAYPLDHCVSLLNPLSADLGVMRQTLLYGGLETIAHNVNRKADDLMLYEMGHVYSFDPQTMPTADAPLAPYSESSRLGLWLTGRIRRASWLEGAAEATFYHMRAVIDNIFARMGIPTASLKFTPSTYAIFAAGLDIASRSGQYLGSVGMVSARDLQLCGIKQPVVYAELQWSALVKLSSRHKVSAVSLPKTMPVSRDLALLVDKSVSMLQIEEVVRQSERKLLRQVTLFDVYEGKNLPEGKKSYAINISLQDDERTLQDRQIDAVMAKITANLERQLQATLR